MKAPMSRPNDLRVWLVTWLDSCGASGWRTRQDARELTPLLCQSVGRLIHVAKNHVVVAGSWSTDNDTVSDVTVIPTRNVKSYRLLTGAA